ncbi:MAG: class I SAM-dependent methyltransferase [Chitinophagaceae bacterium]|nr:class I SAM-dependent methyltransferase [Chitinophagaceae bacterium]
MYGRLQVVKKYVHYYFTAASGKGHGIHSPFIYDFVTNVLCDRRQFYPYEAIESLREDLLKDKTLLDIEDFGAGSAIRSTKQRSIASIARNAAKNKKLCRLLFRMVHYYQPQTIVELGTSLGISSAYMASANQAANVITIEGASSVAAAAKRNHEILQLNNIQGITGKFEDKLPLILQQVEKLDLAFVDGNHRLQPTKNYFEQLLTKATPQSILVFDDIHWSKEMEEAWRIIQQHDRVTASIDLFFLGIILFRPEFRSKQQFTIRF